MLQMMFILLLSSLTVEMAWGKEIKPWKTTAKATYYLDTREYNTLNLLSSTTELPFGFTVWGFVDLHSDQKNASERFDLTRYFIEYRLQRSLNPGWVRGFSGLGIEAEYNEFAGSGNEVVRFGLTYQHGFPLMSDYKGFLRWRVHPYETDGSGKQVSVIYVLPLVDWLSVTGFADLNLQKSGPDRWIAEPQLNAKLNDRFHLVAEYRFNGFEDNTLTLDGSGLALGLAILL